MIPNFQKKNKAWSDESGIEIPANRVSKVEKVKEEQSEKVYKQAVKAEKVLAELFDLIATANETVCHEINAENKLLNKSIKPTKGNHTWYNFDRTLKIECAIQEGIRFDEAKISAARELFDKFIERNVQGTDEIVRQLINSAFANTKGGLDSKKVLSLLKFRSKIKDKQFLSALDLIQDSISRPNSKRYYRVWVKNEEGEYKNIDLNFSSL